MESLEILLSIGGVRIEDENTKLQLAEKKNNGMLNT